MCTVAFWPDNGVAVLSARNMDWLDDRMDTNLWVFPRGMKRVGLAGEGAGKSLEWTSKYGSLTAAAYDIATTDGINEQGLAMHMLWLAQTDYGTRDPSVPGLAVSLWGQFMLDAFATVAEAVEYMRKEPPQLVPVKISEYKLTAAIHLMIEDDSGDAAVFEYVDGKLRIHHSRAYRVMTNEPPFEEQLRNLKRYEGFGGDTPIPGTTAPEDRFVRAEYYLKQLAKPKDYLTAVASLLSVVGNAAQPFGASDPKEPNTAATIWRCVVDHTNRGYYFQSATSPFMVWVDVSKLDFEQGAPVLKLDLRRKEPLAGEVNRHLEPAEPFAWVMP